MASKKKKAEEVAKIENFTWDMLSDVFGDDCVVGEASPDIKGYLHTGCRTLDWAFADREFRGGYPSGRMVEFFGDEGVGKACAYDQDIVTPTGTVKFQDVKVGDMAIGVNGDPVAIIGVYPQGVRQSYRVTFVDNSYVDCDEEHLWAVRTRQQKHRGFGFSVKTTREILQSGKVDNFEVPLVTTNYSRVELPVDPYVLGALIGDGSDLGSSPGISTPDMDAEIVDRMMLRLPGFKVHKNTAPTCPFYRFLDVATNRSKRLSAPLRELGLHVKSPERFIPDAYLHSSVEQRVDLLRGLMDTDGSCSNNKCRFSTMSGRLADDIVLLVNSLGGVAVKHLTDRGEYYVTVRTSFCPFYLMRKASNWSCSSKRPPSRYIKSIVKTRMCEHICIKVDSADGLFMVNNYVVTHNTTMVTHALISAQKGNGVILDWTRENGKLIGRPSATRKMKPGLAILIDSECKYPIERAQNMGLDVDQLVRIVKDDGEPMSFEDCIEAIENTLDRISKITYFDTPEAPVCVVLDSLAQSPIEAEMEGNGLQDGIAAKARKIRMAMRRMTQKLSRMHVYMLFTNHQYARIGAPGSEASGGRGLKLAASLRLAIKKGYPDGQLNASGGEQIGVNSTVTTVKSSVCVPPTPVTVPIVWRTGISPAFEMIKALTDNPEFNSPMLKKGGGGRVELIKPDGELVKPYVYQLVQELEANPELMSYVESLFDTCIRRSV